MGECDKNRRIENEFLRGADWEPFAGDVHS